MRAGYVNTLKSWNSTATDSYTASNGDAITIFNISGNPTIPALPSKQVRPKNRS